MAVETEATDDKDKDKAKHGPLWTLVVERGFPFLTALLTVVSAALGVVSVQATRQNSDLEDQVRVLEEDNDAFREEVEVLTQSRDDWKRRAEQAESAPGTTQPGAAASPADSAASGGGCGLGDEPEIWISPVEVPTEADFVLTLSGSCFEPGERLRVSITEDDDGACHLYLCTALADLEADASGAIPTTTINVRGDVSQLRYSATVFILVAGEENWANQPLSVT